MQVEAVKITDADRKLADLINREALLKTEANEESKCDDRTEVQP